MQKSKWAIDEKLLIGAKFPLYYSLRYLDMEKQNNTLICKTLISKYYFINLMTNIKIKL